jgi:hypothetical protein
MNGTATLITTLLVAATTVAFQVVPGQTSPLAPTTFGGKVDADIRAPGTVVESPPAFGATVSPLNAIVSGFFAGHSNAAAGPAYVNREATPNAQRLLYSQASSGTDRVALTVQNLGDDSIEITLSGGVPGALSVDAQQGRTVIFDIVNTGEIEFQGTNGGPAEFLWSLKRL